MWLINTECGLISDDVRGSCRRGYVRYFSDIGQIKPGIAPDTLVRVEDMC